MFHGRSLGKKPKVLTRTHRRRRMGERAVDPHRLSDYSQSTNSIELRKENALVHLMLYHRCFRSPTPPAAVPPPAQPLPVPPLHSSPPVRTAASRAVRSSYMPLQQHHVLQQHLTRILESLLHRRPPRLPLAKRLEHPRKQSRQHPLQIWLSLHHVLRMYSLHHVHPMPTHIHPLHPP